MWHLLNTCLKILWYRTLKHYIHIKTSTNLKYKYKYHTYIYLQSVHVFGVEETGQNFFILKKALQD